MIICVDFDGTVVKHEYPKVGEDVPGAVETLKKLIADGHQIILYTMRSEHTLEDAKKWYEQKGIKLYDANRNPSQLHWTKSPKVYAQLYIDDAAYGTPLLQEMKDGKPVGRPYVDWSGVYEYVSKLK